jgi:hypothetical protein
MGTWTIDETTTPGIVRVKIDGVISLQEVRELSMSFMAAVDRLQGTPFRVFADLRTLVPLSPEVTHEFEIVKSRTAARSNFQGSAVLTASSVVAMQHRRTSQSSGVLDTELISDDEAACWQHLQTISRPGRLTRH